MYKHDLQSYINAFEGLKGLISEEAQTDTEITYTFINGLSDERRAKLILYGQIIRTRQIPHRNHQTFQQQQQQEQKHEYDRHRKFQTLQV